MSGSNFNALSNPNASASGALDQLFIEKFTGKVGSQFLRRYDFLSQFADVRTVTNTNTVTNKSIGDTELQALTPGAAPDGTAAQFDNHSMVVDTVLIARNPIALLSEVQSDINVLERLAKNQADKLVQLSDETFLQQVAKGSLATAGRVSGHEGGTNVQLSAAGDEVDPVKFLDGIEGMLLGMNNKEVDNEDVSIFIPYEQFYALLGNEEIISQDYDTKGENASKVSGSMLKAFGVRVIPTHRMGAAAQAKPKTSWNGTHLLSNAGNGSRYNVTDDDRDAVAIAVGPDALLAGRTLDVTSDIWFDKDRKTHVADSWMSFGCIADRYEHCGVVRKA